MKMFNLSKLFVLFFLGTLLFQSCSKDALVEPSSEAYSEIMTPDLEETLMQLSNVDLTDFSESASTRNTTCEIIVCATFTGSGRYRVTLPNGTSVFVNLNLQTISINGVIFPLVGNQFCQTITVNHSSTANLAFRGTGSVVVTATVNGVTTTVFEAGVGTTLQVSVSEDVTLTCPADDGNCDLLICANFTGNGRYRVILPNGTSIFVNLNLQTVSINGVIFPLINNQLCEVITIPTNGSATANLGFRGTGSVVVTVTYPDGTSCDVFDAGVGTPFQVSVSEDVTLSCDPPC